MYLLWGFCDYDKACITRGKTQEQAYKHAQKSWQRGQTITFMNTLPIQAARLYDKNHAPGWLHRPPVWLTKENK